MPPRGPAQSSPPPAVAATHAPAATTTPTAGQTPPRQQAAYPVKRSALPPMPGAGVAYAPEPEGNGGNFDFPNLDAGDYLFSAWVDSIIMWPDGAEVLFKCHGIIHLDSDGNSTITKSGVYGREIKWGQTPPPSMGPGSKGFPYWRRDLVTCYRDLGMPDLPDAASGAEGWAAADGEAGALVPPFYSFFTDTIGRAVVPIMFRIKVHVDANYEKYPKVKGLAFEQVGDSYVLAPAPRKLPEWVASMHGWVGEADTIVIKSKGISIPILTKISGINPPADMPTYRTL